MYMDAIERALNSSKSTILFGSLGLNSANIQFYFNAIPDLIPFSIYEPWFFYKGKLLYINIEPPFHSQIAPYVWQIVLTCHMNLIFNKLTTRIEDINISFNRLPIFQDESENILDLSLCAKHHEAFLKICQFLFKSPSYWSLKCPQILRLQLKQELPKLGNSPYKLYLENII